MTDFLAIMREITQQRLAQLPQSIDELYMAAMQARMPHDFATIFNKNKINSSSACIIAEIKFASPSSGKRIPHSNPIAIATQYLMHGASAISILTEEQYFHGSLNYLQQVRQAFPQAYLLMKDFILDERQLLQARIYGADAVLLIAKFLSFPQLQYLYHKALELNLTPLVEVHTVIELIQVQEMGALLIGVNNRELNSLTIDLAIAEAMVQSVHVDTLLICESGIASGQTISHLQQLGYRGFLIGSHLMSQASPGFALSEILNEVKHAS